MRVLAIGSKVVVRIGINVDVDEVRDIFEDIGHHVKLIA